MAGNWARGPGFWHGSTTRMSTYAQPAESFVRERLFEQKSPFEERAPRPADPRPRKLPPPVRFADATQRQKTMRDAERARAIVLMPVCAEPGGLAAAIDADLESVLASRGAMPPSVPPNVVYASVIDDQIARAAALPVRGICLCVPRLSVLVENGDELHEADARTLVAWMEAARAESRLRLVMLFCAEDQHVKLHVPTRLDALVAGPRAPRVSESRSEEARPFDLSPLPPAVAHEAQLELAVTIEASAVIGEAPKDEEDAPEPVEACAPEADTRDAAADDADDDDGDVEEDDAGDDVSALLVAPSLPALELSAAVVLSTPEIAAAPAPEPAKVAPIAETLRPPRFEAELEVPVEAGAERDAAEEEAVPEVPVKAERVATIPKLRGAVPAAAPEKKSFAERVAEMEARAIESSGTGGFASPRWEEEQRAEAQRAARVVSVASWRNVGLELDAARGPRPVSVVEKLYATKYVPLLAALQRGEVDRATGEIWNEWRKSFAESYETAFSALRVTGKRPTMVMDAPDVAMKVARLASARSVKLVMIDSMSWDLGERVAARVGAALEKRAALVDKTTLWSALPAMTSVQMHLLARGADGLKDIPGPASEPDVTRGRNVSALRREKLGTRELYKLDLVEARLRSQGAGYDERLDALADEVSDVLVKLMETLPPRTLVYVFGDHGFVLEPGTNGWATGAAQQGGASPEEVLVSGHGWLVDAVQ